MAKKDGMMNDDKHMKSMDPMKVANVMAKAAHIKVQKMGKAYQDGADGDEVQAQGSGDTPNPGKGGTQHPSAPARQASSYDGKMQDEMTGGSDHPTAPGKKKMSGKQVAAMKYQGK